MKPTHAGWWRLWAGDRWFVVEVWRFKGRTLAFRHPIYQDTFGVRKPSGLWGTEVEMPAAPPAEAGKVG